MKYSIGKLLLLVSLLIIPVKSNAQVIIKPASSVLTNPIVNGSLTLTAGTIDSNLMWGSVTTGIGSSGGDGSLIFTANNIYVMGLNNVSMRLGPAVVFGWTSVNPSAGTLDTILARDAANIMAMRNSTTAQQFNIYNTYTSSTNNEYFTIDWKTTSNRLELSTNKGSGGGTARDFALRSATGKILLTPSVSTAASQLVATQTTVPTCTSANNCGTGNGTFATGSNDTAGSVTLGTTPASGFIITFNGTWAAAPTCTVWMNKAGMVTGKSVLTSVTSTTTITVVTNGTAPATGDIYAYHCIGIQ